MVSLQGLGLSTSTVATRIMTSALIDDIGSLIMVAIVVPIATGTGELTVAALATTAGKAVLFFVIDIAYVQHDILPRDAFFTLMITAFVLNILVPLTITFWRPRYLAAVDDKEVKSAPVP